MVAVEALRVLRVARGAFWTAVQLVLAADRVGVRAATVAFVLELTARLVVVTGTAVRALLVDDVIVSYNRDAWSRTEFLGRGDDQVATNALLGGHHARESFWTTGLVVAAADSVGNRAAAVISAFAKAAGLIVTASSSIRTSCGAHSGLEFRHGVRDSTQFLDHGHSLVSQSALLGGHPAFESLRTAAFVVAAADSVGHRAAAVLPAFAKAAGLIVTTGTSIGAPCCAHSGLEFRHIVLDSTQLLDHSHRMVPQSTLLGGHLACVSLRTAALVVAAADSIGQRAAAVLSAFSKAAGLIVTTGTSVGAPC